MSTTEQIQAALQEIGAAIAQRVAEDGSVAAGQVEMGAEALAASVGNTTTAWAEFGAGANGALALSLSNDIVSVLAEGGSELPVHQLLADTAGAFGEATGLEFEGVDGGETDTFVGRANGAGAVICLPLFKDGTPIGALTVVTEDEASASAIEFEAFDEGGSVTPINSRSLELLNDVEMDVSVELGRTRLPVRELLGLAPGSVVELDRAAGSPVDLLVNGTLIAKGEVVVIDEEFGIRITEIVGHDESTKNVG